MERIIKELQNSSRKKIELKELHNIVKEHSYEKFVLIVTELCEKKIIKPVSSSGKNGKNPPLYMKYHILPKIIDNVEILTEIKLLHHLINTEHFLKNPEKYAKNRRIFFELSEYLKNNFDLLKEPMSENERAYAIWHDEKLLDSPENISALKDCNIFNILNTYSTPEPFFDYRTASSPKSVLIIENKDTWFSVRKLMMENKCGINLFNIFFDCVLLGEGKKVARSTSSVSEYLSLDSLDNNVYYWGDIDYEGINIFLMTKNANPELNIKLFVPAYKIMIDEFEKIYYNDDKIFKCKNTQKKPHDMSVFLLLFESEIQEKIINILENRTYIPQEIINYQILKRFCL